jgi:hypothetical protein
MMIKAIKALLIISLLASSYVKAQDADEIDKKQFEMCFKSFEDVYSRYSCIYQKNRVFVKDTKTSLITSRILAEFGDPIAFYSLAEHYEDGAGVLKDDKTAFKYAELSAKNGYFHGQYKLSRYYLKGIGTEKSLEKSYFWLFITTVGGGANPHYGLISMELKDLAKELNYYGIYEIERKASKCKDTNYKSCD